jgi:hypothetical protein
MSLLPLASPAHPKVAFYWIPGWKSTNMLAGRTTLSQAITESDDQVSPSKKRFALQEIPIWKIQNPPDISGPIF